MKHYGLTGLTAYAAVQIDEQLPAAEQVALLRAHQDDDELLEVELRRLVADKALSSADAEFAAVALDEVDWERLIAAMRELVTIEVRLPCGHEQVTFTSFGGYDARHGERGVDPREAAETFEHTCASCQAIYDVLLTSKADGLDLRRRFVFTTRPTQAVYVERLQFNPGDELPKCSSGAWKQGSPYTRQGATS